MNTTNDKAVDDATLSVAMESTSALMDNEANDLDLARVLRDSGNSDDVRSFWIRQQAYRHAMQGSGLPRQSIDISSGVMAAISEDKRRYANPLVSMAVAASVTVAVVLGGQQALLFTDQPLNTITAPGAVVQLPGTGAVQASFAQSSSPLPPLVSPPGQTAPNVAIADQRSSAANTRALYNQLAVERSQSLASVHQTTARAASISPFIARATEPRLDQ